MRRLLWTVLLFGALAALAGCGAAEPAEPGDPPTPSVARTGNGVSPTPDPQAGTALVVFERQGGLAGVDDRLVVQPDGRWVITNRDDVRKQGTLTPAELATLRSALQGFEKLPTENPGGGVVDGYTYRIRYAGREVTAADGDLPPALTQVIGPLNELLGRYGG